jgi:regulator of sigma E protease
MTVLIKILQLLFSLSILVLLHEFGHFITARLFKTKVEKFYLFFDPWFHLFKFKRKDTEYGIGWLPLGGYCKIAGMIDESMDKEQLKQPPQPWEFRSKPTWQRLIIMLGGVTMNIILAICIYIITLSLWGEEYLPTANVTNGIGVDSLGVQLGLRNGDKILTVDNHKVNDFFKIPAYIILNNAKTIQIVRDGQEKNIVIPDGFISRVIKHNNADFITPQVPYRIEGFTAKSPAKNAGIKVNDQIIGFNNIKTIYFNEFRNNIVKYKNQEVTIVLLRNKDTLRTKLRVTEKGLIGVKVNLDLNKYFRLEKKNYSVIQAIPGGTVKAYKMIGDYLKQLKLIFSPETKAYESLGGFISIGNIFPSEWDWHAFWTLTAFLSIILAIMNVLPIPALDGGHVLFLFYEIITGRKPSDKFLEYAQIAGMIILLSLLVFANGNDIFKLLKK